MLDAIGRRIDVDPRVDAYVKLQLLSAVEKFDRPFATQVINAYVAAPQLLPMPALDQSDRKAWDDRAARAKKGDVDRINDQLGREVAGVEVNDLLLTNYRDALRARGSAFRAGWSPTGSAG